MLDRGFWAAFTIYPNTKMGNERMVEIARQYGSDRIFVDSSADWGVSDPLAVPKTARLMLERGIAQEDVEALCYGNALKAFGQSGQMKEDDWLNAAAVDQRMLFEGNSVLRGQKPRVGAGAESQRRRRTGVQIERSLQLKHGELRSERRTGQSLPQRGADRTAVYKQEFSVRYDYPVYFTEHLFARDNPVLPRILAAP